MLTNSRDIKRRLEQEGWIVDRVTGSYHVFKHPMRPYGRIGSIAPSGRACGRVNPDRMFHHVVVVDGSKLTIAFDKAGEKP
jgi:hypothetical protein